MLEFDPCLLLSDNRKTGEQEKIRETILPGQTTFQKCQTECFQRIVRNFVMVILDCAKFPICNINKAKAKEFCYSVFS